MLAYCSTPYFNANTFSPFCTGSHGILFNDVIDQLDRTYYYNQGQRILEKISKPNNIRQVEADDKHQIQIFKRCGNFNGYEIKVTRNVTGNYFLKIEGNNHKFEKLYELDPDAVDIGEIDRRWYREENVLVLNIPKKNRRRRSAQRPTIKNVKKSNSKKSDRRKTKHEKNLKHTLRNLEAIQEEQGLRYEDQTEIPKESEQEQGREEHQKQEHEENIHSSSTDTDIALESDVPSEAGSIPSEPIKIRKKRLPSIEEVEDEEFISLRKNMF